MTGLPALETYLRRKRLGLWTSYSEKQLGDGWAAERARSREQVAAISFALATIPSEHPGPCGTDACWLCAAETRLREASSGSGEAPAGLTEDEWRQVASGIITEGLRDKACAALRGASPGEVVATESGEGNGDE